MLDTCGKQTIKLEPGHTIMPWDDPLSQLPDSACSTFSPLDTALEDSNGASGGNLQLTLNSTAVDTDFTELKPLAFEYPTVVNGAGNNNRASVADLNSFGCGGNSKVSAGSQQTCVGSASSTSSGYFSPPSDVSSTAEGSSSPPVIKLESLDFTPDQTAFDDIACLIGTSMGADSTVPNQDNDTNPEWSDLDAWIESTANHIQQTPLVIGGASTSGLETSLVLTQTTADSSGVRMTSLLQQQQQQQQQQQVSSQQQQQQRTYLGQMCDSMASGCGTSANNVIATSSTLQTLLTQGQGKVTQLQRREPPAYSLPPAGLSILQSRLQHGHDIRNGKNYSLCGTIMKVDTTSFDGKQQVQRQDGGAGTTFVMKAEPSGYLGGTPSYVSSDTMPHSSLSPLNHVVSTTEPGLHHRRFADFGGTATKSKKKSSQLRSKIGFQTDAGKEKMIHRCTICNRGFLNKSNIKVHLRTHTGEKPFKCETCSKAFRQKAHLLKHMRIHKGIPTRE